MIQFLNQKEQKAESSLTTADAAKKEKAEFFR